MEDSKDEDMRCVIAGILDKIEDMTLFMNPVRESYLRLGHNRAPKYISWSHQNRSQLIRIPAVMDENKRAELRSPDPLANPYLSFGLMIYAALNGLEKKLELPEAADVNFFKADKSIISKYRQLPDSLELARQIAIDSDFISKYVPKEIVELYC